MSIIDEIFDFMEGLQDDEEIINNEHGKLVQIRFDAYYDVYIYEDGHEEYFYIGD